MVYRVGLATGVETPLNKVNFYHFKNSDWVPRLGLAALDTARLWSGGKNYGIYSKKYNFQALILSWLVVLKRSSQLGHFTSTLRPPFCSRTLKVIFQPLKLHIFLLATLHFCLLGIFFKRGWKPLAKVHFYYLKNYFTLHGTLRTQ